jgi:tetratricopeptide (TPR) repeat protein
MEKHQHGHALKNSSAIAGLCFGFAVLLLTSACATQPPAPPPAARADFDVVMREATVAMSRGDYHAAVEHLSEAVALRPDAARAHNYLGMAYEQRNQHDLAKRSFEMAVYFDPSFAAAYNNLGSVCSLKGDYQQATAHFDRALTLAPDMVAALYNMGNALLALGRVEDATPYLLKALTLDPDFLDSSSTLVANVRSDQLGGPEASFLYAKLFASLGNVERTFQYLQRARAEGFTDWQRIVDDRGFDAVRQDPRLAEFLAH